MSTANLNGAFQEIDNFAEVDSGQERATPTEINTGGQAIRALAFTANGEYLVSGDKDGVRVWKMSDNQKPWATLKAKDVRCVAVSSDRGWIAAGKSWGEITVWDTQSFKEVFTHDEDGHTVTGVDFSPDSTRLVSASGNRAVSVWDVASGERVVGPLNHPYWVVAAKFSPRGDKIATATYLRDLIRIYDINGNKLVEFSGKVTPYYNTGLLWSNRDESIFILSNNVIKLIDVSSSTSTSTAVISQWSITESNFPSIVSPRFGDFIAFSSNCTVTRCDMSTGNQLPLIQLSQDAHCIAISSDGRVLASGGGDGKIVIKALPVARRNTVELGQGIAQAELLIQNEKSKPKSLRSRHGQSINYISGSGSN